MQSFNEGNRHLRADGALQREPDAGAATAARRTLVVFQVAGQRYAIASREVAQVIPMAELQSPPAASQLLAGFLDMAGELVPVIRLHHLFGLPGASLGLWTPLVVLRGAPGRLALLVDSVDRALAIDDAAVLPLPEDRGCNDCTIGVVRFQEESILLISPQRLLLRQERQAIAEWQQTVQQRIDDLEGASA